MPSEARCQSCGFKSERVYFGKAEAFIAATIEVPYDREGEFDKCPNCGSIDVEVLSAEGVLVMARIAAVDARTV